MASVRCDLGVAAVVIKNNSVLLVKEAGGRVTKLDGERWNVDSNEILASNNNIHNEFVGAPQIGRLAMLRFSYTF